MDVFSKPVIAQQGWSVEQMSDGTEVSVPNLSAVSAIDFVDFPDGQPNTSRRKLEFLSVGERDKDMPIHARPFASNYNMEGYQAGYAAGFQTHPSTNNVPQVGTVNYDCKDHLDSSDPEHAGLVWPRVDWSRFNSTWGARSTAHPIYTSDPRCEHSSGYWGHPTMQVRVCPGDLTFRPNTYIAIAITYGDGTTIDFAASQALRYYRIYMYDTPRQMAPMYFLLDSQFEKGVQIDFVPPSDSERTYIVYYWLEQYSAGKWRRGNLSSQTLRIGQTSKMNFVTNRPRQFRAKRFYSDTDHSVRRFCIGLRNRLATNIGASGESATTNVMMYGELLELMCSIRDEPGSGYWYKADPQLGGDTYYKKLKYYIYKHTFTRAARSFNNDTVTYPAIQNQTCELFMKGTVVTTRIVVSGATLLEYATYDQDISLDNHEIITNYTVGVGLATVGALTESTEIYCDRLFTTYTVVSVPIWFDDEDRLTECMTTTDLKYGLLNINMFEQYSSTLRGESSVAYPSMSHIEFHDIWNRFRNGETIDSLISMPTYSTSVSGLYFPNMASASMTTFGVGQYLTNYLPETTHYDIDDGANWIINYPVSMSDYTDEFYADVYREGDWVSGKVWTNGPTDAQVSLGTSAPYVVTNPFVTDLQELSSCQHQSAKDNNNWTGVGKQVVSGAMIHCDRLNIDQRENKCSADWCPWYESRTPTVDSYKGDMV